MARRKLLHIRSNVVENGKAKLPTSDQIEYGEIAINFADGHETMSIRNNNDEITTFSSDEYFEKIIEEDENVTAAALNDLETRKTDRTELASLADVVNTKLDDVKIDGESVVTSNVANIPFATTTNYGVVIVDNTLDSGSTNTVANSAVTKVILDNEKVISSALNDLEERKANLSDIPNVTIYFDDVRYNSENKTIEFYNNNVLKDTLDATNFIKDGMVSSVEVKDVESGGTSVNCIVVTFNTDSGHEDINIPITEIFDSSLYYTKTESDAKYGKVDDVIANGASIVVNKVATIPTATTSEYGIVIVDNAFDSGSTNPIQNKVLDATLTEMGKVTAAALNDLETRKSNRTELDSLSEVVGTKLNDVTIDGTSVVENNVAIIPSATTSSYGVVKVDDVLDSGSTNPIQNNVITKTIYDNEEVVSAALNDLNTSVQDLSTYTEDNIELLSQRASDLETIVGPNEVDDFNPSVSYAKGDFVLYDGKLYKFNENHAVGEWDASEVTETNLFSEIEYMVKTDYEEVVIILQDESGNTLPNVFVAVQVEGEESARNFTSDTEGRCVTNVTKGLEYTVSANNVPSYYPPTTLVRRASIPRRYVIVTYIEDTTLTTEHLKITFSYSDTTLEKASWVRVSYGGNDYQLSIVDDVAETDIKLGTVYQVSFEDVLGYKTPSVKTYTAEFHGTRPLNIRYQAPISGIRWLMTNGVEREINDVTNEERINGEIFGLIVNTEKLINQSGFLIPLSILLNSGIPTGQWLSSNVDVTNMGHFGNATAALSDIDGKTNCNAILEFISGKTYTSSMVSSCKNKVGGAPTFSIEESYDVGDYVIYSTNLYQFTQAHEPGAFNEAETSGAMKGYKMPPSTGPEVRQCFCPAYGQLNEFRINRSAVNSFTEDAFRLTCVNISSGTWWTSTQNSATYGVYMNNGGFYGTKTNAYNVLPVLAY